MTDESDDEPTLLIALAAAATQSLLAPFSDPPGVHTGTNSAGAEGPMQFEPATFTAVAHQLPARATTASPSPYDPRDAIYAAAPYL